MGLSRVRAIFFDLDNTLIDTAGASRRGMLEVIKLLQSKYHYKEEAEIICDKVQVKLSKECFHPYNTCITDLRTSHWEEAIQETKGGAANRKLAEECYFLWKSTRLQHMTLAEDVKAMLTELRKEVRLLLLTNGDRQTQREKIEACACQSYFDAVVVGGEQREEKPAPSIFYYCCNLLGVQPGDCVMVGDTLETDIQGGLNAGLKATVWINKNGIVPLKSSPVPHYIVSSVLELPALLQSIDCKRAGSNFPMACDRFLQLEKAIKINTWCSFTMTFSHLCTFPCSDLLTHGQRPSLTLFTEVGLEQR
ncbi:N-acylneuraminate-9-phosphatase isoform X1 [Rhinopithecus roxellana]|uniref:N-acylneuraminate-9-phosphatase isoform X1 n=1 Tax=Rhinopithecus roxellana TaxID=61622 RepID=UPI0012378043|nr:N-acylneuraminate-9-phosphatase isoform X1 [Rhinopithecus roxellana]XP_030771656.1 N-acylneuraminate-9-phosphatase isoform X1 [Rhinopithecus roxellana]